MRILALFLHDCEYGKKIRGDERRFLEVAKQFKGFGAELYVVEWSPSLQKSFRGYEHTYTSFEIKKPRLKILRIPYLIIKALTISRKLSFDIVYLHNQDIVNMLLGYILKLILNKPLVVVFHWEYRLFEEGLLRNIKQTRSLLTSLPLLILSVFIKKFVFPRVDLYFAVSEEIKKYLINELQIRSEKIIISGNGVDCSKFKPCETTAKYYGAFLGRIDFSQKGIDILLKAWKIVLAQKPSAKLVIIGGFESEDDNNRLYELLSKLDLNNNVQITGFVQDEEIVKYLSMSKVFVFPTRFEGFGLSIIEAMACGLPCITSAIPVLRELHSNVAIFVKPNDYYSFARAIVSLLDEEKDCKKLGNLSRTHALRFEWARVSEREISAIRGVLNESPY